MATLTIEAALDQATRTLRTASQSPELDAEVLLADVRRQSRTWLLTHSQVILTARQEQRFHQLIQRRQSHEPIPYLTGQSEFFGLSLQITPAVLVPRPFTELLVEALLARLPTAHSQRLTIVDIGTGSGAIALAVASRHRSARIIGTDVSPSALRLARANAKQLHLRRRLTWKQGSLLTPLTRRDAPDVIIANLPYLTGTQLLAPSISCEPRLALDGGLGGLKLIAELMTQAAAFPSITIMALEFDPAQQSRVRGYLQRWSPRVTIWPVSDGRRVRGLIAKQ